MRNVRLILAYDGTDFHGWQRQPDAPTIQACLEGALHKLTGAPTPVTGSGRTDAGVHALGQVAHFDLEKRFAADKVRDALNYHLRPDPVAVLTADEVSEDFHARFSARARHYLYRIVCRRAPLALDAGRAWHVMNALDAEAMGRAAQRLIGRHDFTTFRASLCQAKSPVKTLDVLGVVRQGEEVRVTARARSFLHHQVRNMVGTLALVGEGKWTDADVAAALEARDRTRGGPTAPACGLYLPAVRS